MVGGGGDEGRNCELLAAVLDSFRELPTLALALSHWFLMGCRPFCWSTGVDSGVGRAASSGGWQPSQRIMVLTSPWGDLRSLPLLSRLVYILGESMLGWYS